MRPISEFLNKFQNIGLEDRTIREITVKVLKKILDIDLKSSDIKYSKGQIEVTGGGVLKSEIYMRKKKIISEINLIAGGGKVINIK